MNMPNLAFEMNSTTSILSIRHCTIVRTVPGKLLQEVEIPGAKRITSCCFGGPNLDELYVTSCAFDFTEDDYKEQPNGGSLFRVTGLGVKGTPSVKYAG